MKLAYVMVAALIGLPAHAATAPTLNTNSLNRSAAAVSGAPNLQIYGPAGSQSDLCIGEISGAYGSPMLAITLDMTHLDKVCARLRQSWFLCAHNLCAAGIQLQCLDGDVRQAMKLAGTPCEAQTATYLSRASQ